MFIVESINAVNQTEDFQKAATLFKKRLWHRCFRFYDFKIEN